MSYDFESMGLTEIQTLLRGWRENNYRRSEDIVEIWELHIKNNTNKLGKEKHVVLEQMIFASLDCHMFDIAEECIGILSAQFPGSLRVHRYQAMKLEAMEKYDEALEFLDSLIKRDETNAAPRKRRVAIFKARGRILEAIKELTEYLKKFMSDVEAWQELCDLYLSQADYSKAVFCAEELLLHQPHSHLFHQRVADIRYTMGGIENMELSKTYYWQAIQLNPKNMRALLGLYLVCNNLASLYKSSGSNKKKAWQLSLWALNQISILYAAAGENVPVLVGPKGQDKQKDQVKDLIDSFAAITMG
ncbi:ER membrane protein complex subunit 2-like [Arctopsyche grandis]|uniref:ER membrane protein complex subunit 2-like n=1 Tax=Arctopsyche grandis TaxID=121162 RepID=UPI00406D7F8A